MAKGEHWRCRCRQDVSNTHSALCIPTRVQSYHDPRALHLLRNWITRLSVKSYLLNSGY